MGRIAGNRGTAAAIRLHDQPASDPAIGTGGTNSLPAFYARAHERLKYVLSGTITRCEIDRNECRRPQAGHRQLMLVSHARFREARRDRGERDLAQVVPPRARDAARIESEEHHQTQGRTTGRGNRGAKAARDWRTAARANCSDESERRGGLDTRSL